MKITMEHRHQIAEKLLRHARKDHKSIRSFSASDTDALLPGTSLEVLHRVFSDLDNSGAITYMSKADYNLKDRRQRQNMSLEVVCRVEELEKYIKVVSGGIAGFDVFSLNNGQVILTAIRDILNIKRKRFKLEDISLKPSVNAKLTVESILQQICKFTDAIKFELIAYPEVFIDDDGGGYGLTGRVQNVEEYRISNRTALRKVYKNIKTAVEGREARIRKLLKDGPVHWRCVSNKGKSKSCGCHIGTLDTMDKVLSYLKSFDKKRYTVCKRCRSKNSFQVTDDGVFAASVL